MTTENSTLLIRIKRFFTARKELLESTDNAIDILIGQLNRANAENVKLINGAKKSIVTIDALKEAIRYQERFIDYIRENHYDIYKEALGTPSVLTAAAIVQKRVEEAHAITA